MARKNHQVVQPRKAPRYCLQLPVTFAWKDGEDEWQQRAGLTRDLSAQGAFIFTTDAPPSGAHLELHAYLPTGKINPPIWITGKGRVVRAESSRNGNRRGFAVALPRLVLSRGEQPS